MYIQVLHNNLDILLNQNDLNIFLNTFLLNSKNEKLIHLIMNQNLKC